MNKNSREYIAEKAKEIVNNLVKENISFYIMNWIFDQCKEEIKLLIPSKSKN